MHEHSVREWIEEAVPIAVVLTVWNLLAAIVPWPGLSTGLRFTGIAIVLVYVVGRGWAHAEHLDAPSWSGMGDVVSSNVAVIKAAGLWFLAAFVVYVFQSAWQWVFQLANVNLPGPLVRPVAWLGSALAATGLAVALIYLVASAVATSREGAAEEGFRLTSDEDDAATDDGDADGDGDGDDESTETEE